MIRSAYYNLQAIYYNIIINFLLVADIFVPNYFKNIIINYQNNSIKCINFSLFIDLSTNISKKYNIDLIKITQNISNLYEKIKNNNELTIDDNDSIILSDIDDNEYDSDISI